MQMTLLDLLMATHRTAFAPAAAGTGVADPTQSGSFLGLLAQEQLRIALAGTETAEALIPSVSIVSGEVEEAADSGPGADADLDGAVDILPADADGEAEGADGETLNGTMASTAVVGGIFVNLLVPATPAVTGAGTTVSVSRTLPGFPASIEEDPTSKANGEEMEQTPEVETAPAEAVSPALDVETAEGAAVDQALVDTGEESAVTIVRTTPAETRETRLSDVPSTTASTAPAAVSEEAPRSSVVVRVKANPAREAYESAAVDSAKLDPAKAAARTVVSQAAAAMLSSGVERVEANVAGRVQPVESVASEPVKGVELPADMSRQYVVSVRTDMGTGTGTGTDTGKSGSAFSASVDAPRVGVEPPERSVTLQALSDHTVRSVRYLAARGEQSLSVRLIPESLGEMHIEVQRNGDTMTVRLASASATVRGTLESQANVLRDALTRDGFDSVRVEVSTSLAQSGSFGNASQRQAGEYAAPTARQATYYQSPSDTSGIAQETSTRRVTRHDGAMDVFV